MKRIILGMSESQRDIRRRIVDKCEEMDEHLVKLILYPNNESVNHWKGEIYSLLHRVERQRHNNRYPKYDFIRDALAVDEDIIDNFVRGITDEYSMLVPVNLSYSQVAAKVISYHDWLAYELSTNGQILKSQCDKKLDSIIYEENVHE